jgi:ribose 1,5-bisphosphokinase PhnN
MSLSEALGYEFYKLKEGYKSLDFWLIVISMLGIFLAFKQKYGILAIILIVELIILAKRDYNKGLESGDVKRYERQKLGILSKSELKKLKNDTQMQELPKGI